MVELGYRPEIDIYSWAPSGRPLVHPPIFHYLIFGITRILPFISALDIMLYIGPFVAVFGALGWFLLSKELFESWFAGLIGSSVYAVLLLPFVQTTIAGGATPENLAEAFGVLALALFFHAYKTRKWKWILCSGFTFGLAWLTWETTMFLFLPLIPLFLILLFVSKKADWQGSFLCLVTLGVPLIMGLPFYVPVWLQYGFYENTPSFMLANTFTFYRPAETLVLIISLFLNNHLFLLISLIAFPFLVIYSFTRRENLPREFIGLLFMGIGVGGLLLGAGLRLFITPLGFGILLLFTSVTSKGWKAIQSFPSKQKIPYVLALSVLIGASALYSSSVIAEGVWPHYNQFKTLTPLFGNEIPYNSTIITWWGDSAFFLAHDMRTVWDQYLEHLPPWASTQARKVVKIFMARNEGEALKLMREFNATYILVSRGLAYPNTFQFLLEALGKNDDPETYFKVFPITESRPVLATGPDGKPLTPPQVIRFEDVVVGYEFGPTDKGRSTLLACLIWNKQTELSLKGLPMPPAPRHFKLIWKSGDAFLYEVIS